MPLGGEPDESRLWIAPPGFDPVAHMDGDPEFEEVRTFGSGEVFYVQTGASAADAALGRARARFVAGRIGVGEFERQVELALELEPAHDDEEPTFRTPKLDGDRRQ